MSKWKSVWERRDVSSVQLSLTELINIDGFTMSLNDNDVNGFNPTENWNEWIDSICLELGVLSGTRVVELGCGAGAFLLPLSKYKVDVTGVDFAQPMLDVAQKVLPNAEFVFAEIKDTGLPSSSFDYVF